MLSREERLARSMPPVVVEMLEQRRLMTLTFDLESGILTVTGTSNAEAISVSVNGTDNSIYIVENSTTTYGPYSPSTITQYIKILAGGGNDSVYVDHEGAGEVSEKIMAYGDAGNDYIEGANLADTLYGGDGADQIRAYGGNDVIWAGAGNDTLYGGDGSDDLKCEGGDDLAYGDGVNETGDDTVYGGDGYDSLYGGNGDDVLNGEADGDVVIGQAGWDTMLGGLGDDWFDAADGGGRDSVDGGAGVNSIAMRYDSGFDTVVNMSA
jgi:Ca2+-binding RTX toxin-like protein